MKTIIILLFLAIIIESPSFGRSTNFAVAPDSIPSRHRHQLKFTLQDNADKKNWSTMVVYPAKNRSGSEIGLPIGFNKNTVQVHLGDKLLLPGEDYIFLSNSDRIRILSEKVLTSYNPLQITYERVTLNFKQ